MYTYIQWLPQNYIPTIKKWTNLNVFQFSTSVFRVDGVVLQRLIWRLVILRQVYIFLMHAGYHFLLEVQTRPYMHHQLFPPLNDIKSGYAINKHLYFRLFEILIKLIFNTRRMLNDIKRLNSINNDIQRLNSIKNHIIN